MMGICVCHPNPGIGGTLSKCDDQWNGLQEKVKGICVVSMLWWMMISTSNVLFIKFPPLTVPGHS